LLKVGIAILEHGFITTGMLKKTDLGSIQQNFLETMLVESVLVLSD
jgi:hypothetical protein